MDLAFLYGFLALCLGIVAWAMSFLMKYVFLGDEYK
jgi:hypothetical protein